MAHLRGRFQEQMLAVGRIKHLGGYVEMTPRRGWARFLMGGDAYFDVDSVTLSGCRADRTVVESLCKLFTLRELFAFNYPITDGDVRRVQRATRLRTLSFCNTEISDQWLTETGGLEGLEVLGLYDVRITDAGLLNVPKLTKLRVLSLGSAGVTDAALGRLLELPKLEELDLGGTSVSDKGIDALARLTRLKLLDVRGTSVTLEGYISLRNRLPGVAMPRYPEWDEAAISAEHEGQGKGDGATGNGDRRK